MLASKKSHAEGATAAGRTDDARPAAPVPRSEGRLTFGFKRRQAHTVLDSLYQSGSLKARLAYAEPGHCTEAVLVNTAGGLTGGDRQEIAIGWQAGSRAAVTTLACEKFYRAAVGSAHVTTRLKIGQGAGAEWLPQEAIVFDRAGLDRDLQVHMDVGAVFTGIESVILGRTAMGEVVTQARLRDAWRIWRGNRLIYADVIAMDGEIQPILTRAAGANHRNAWASLLHIGAGAEAKLERIRALPLEDGNVLAAASAWDGILAVRLLADSGAALRHKAITVLDAIRDGCALPRVWQI